MSNENRARQEARTFFRSAFRKCVWSLGVSVVVLGPTLVHALDVQEPRKTSPGQAHLIPDVSCMDVLFADGSVWVWAHSQRRRVHDFVRIDPRSSAITARVSVWNRRGFWGDGPGPSDFAIGYGALWVAHGNGVYRIDPDDDAEVHGRTKRETGRVEGIPGSNLMRLAVGGGATWVLRGKNVYKVDPHTGELKATIYVGAGLGGLATGDGSIWGIYPWRPVLYRIDPTTNRIAARIPLPKHWPGTRELLSPPGEFVVGPGQVWVSYGHGIMRVDPAAREFTPLLRDGDDVSVGPSGLRLFASRYVGDGKVETELVEIDVARNDVVNSIDLGTISKGMYVSELAVGEENLWVCRRQQLYRVPLPSNSAR